MDEPMSEIEILKKKLRQQQEDLKQANRQIKSHKSEIKDLKRVKKQRIRTMKEGYKRKIDQRETTIEDLKAKLKEYQHMKG